MHCAHRDSSASPDYDNQPGRNQQKQCHPQQQTFSAEALGHRFGEVAGKDPARDGAATHHPEHALGFARGQHIIRQGPDLSGYQHPEDFYPDVENRKQQ